MSNIYDYKQWGERIFEAEGTPSFTYSENPNATEASRENASNYQKYIGLSGTLDGIVGKIAIGWKPTDKATPTFTKENEGVRMNIQGYKLSVPGKKVGAVILYSDNAKKNKAPYMRVVDVPNTGPKITYHKDYSDSLGTAYVNEVLKNILLERAFPNRREDNPLFKG